MAKILICGDSFAADWSTTNPRLSGWPNVLSTMYNVTNIAQAGCGEYKVLKQIQSVNLAAFDAVIVAHTSPNRIYCKEHPIHTNKLHVNADLIYSDLLAQADIPDVKVALDFFARYFDTDHARDISNLIGNEICNILGQYNINQFHIVSSISSKEYPDFPSFNINNLFKNHRGSVNHLDSVGNAKMLKIITSWLDEVLREKEINVLR